MYERPMDSASIQSAIAPRLPQRARWLIGDTTLDFSLYKEPRNLTAVFGEWGFSDADVADIEHVSDFIVFGMWNYNEGGGARPLLVVRQSDGKVFGMDVEADDPLFCGELIVGDLYGYFLSAGQISWAWSANPC
jgi:hypothetical protein